MCCSLSKTEERNRTTHFYSCMLSLFFFFISGEFHGKTFLGCFIQVRWPAAAPLPAWKWTSPWVTWMQLSLRMEQPSRSRSGKKQCLPPSARCPSSPPSTILDRRDTYTNIHMHIHTRYTHSHWTVPPFCPIFINVALICLPPATQHQCKTKSSWNDPNIYTIQCRIKLWSTLNA